MTKRSKILVAYGGLLYHDLFVGTVICPLCLLQVPRTILPKYQMFVGTFL